MAEASFRNGHPLMVDYTPSADMAEGEVVVLSKVPFIAHKKIAANALGSVAAGGGVYEVAADGALAAGDKVYWNDTANQVTKTAAAGAHEHFGFVAAGASSAAAGDKLDVIHQPDGTAI